MRLLVLSDLHLEFADFEVSVLPSEVDAIVLAGDIDAPRNDMARWVAALSRLSADKPIVLVAGNHEFYGSVIQAQRAQMRKACPANVHFLDPGQVVFDGGRIRMLGCTLWTDFELPVITETGSYGDQRRAMKEADFYLADYRRIEYQLADGGRRKLAPADTLEFHVAERRWLAEQLRQPFAGTTIVVTHHAPCVGSVTSQWAADWLTPAFVSELPREFFDVPELWIHGHTHTSFDYRIGRTRVVCNPRGYPWVDGRATENPSFDPALVVQVPEV